MLYSICYKKAFGLRSNYVWHDYDLLMGDRAANQSKVLAEKDKAVSTIDALHVGGGDTAGVLKNAAHKAAAILFIAYLTEAHRLPHRDTSPTSPRHIACLAEANRVIRLAKSLGKSSLNVHKKDKFMAN